MNLYSGPAVARTQSCSHAWTALISQVLTEAIKHSHTSNPLTLSIKASGRFRSTMTSPSAPNDSSAPITPASPFGVMRTLFGTFDNSKLLHVWSQQRDRRNATQTALFYGNYTTSSSTSSVSRPGGETSRPGGQTSRPGGQTSRPGGQTSPSLIDPAIEFSFSSDPERPTDPAAVDAHITSQIISGASNSLFTTSQQVFSTCMSTTDIMLSFPAVYESKKNRSATTPSLFEFIATNEKQVIFPSTQQGEKLRTVLKDMIIIVSSEYQLKLRRKLTQN